MTRPRNSMFTLAESDSLDWIDGALADIRAEIDRTAGNLGGFHSPYEAIAAIEKQTMDLWDEIRKRTGTSAYAYQQAMQIAAMSVLYMLVCLDDRYTSVRRGNPMRLHGLPDDGLGRTSGPDDGYRGVPR